MTAWVTGDEAWKGGTAGIKEGSEGVATAREEKEYGVEWSGEKGRRGQPRGGGVKEWQ